MGSDVPFLRPTVRARGNLQRKHGSIISAAAIHVSPVSSSEAVLHSQAPGFSYTSVLLEFRLGGEIGRTCAFWIWDAQEEVSFDQSWRMVIAQSASRDQTFPSS
jgi:hypothetical protein